VAVVSVLEKEWLIAGTEDPLITPLAQRRHHRPEGAAFVGEEVVVTPACVVIGNPFEDACVDECVEAGCQDVAGDAEAVDEVVEAADAEEAVAQDQQGPPFANDLQRLGDGAVHIGERCLAHGSIVRELRDRTQPANISCMTELSSGDRNFEMTTTLTMLDGQPGSFSANLDTGWSSLVGVHGGYMCAIAVRAAEKLASGDRVVRTQTTSFLRTGAVGPATVCTNEVRRGRSMSTVVAEVNQGGRTVLTSRMTLVVPRAGVEWSEPSPFVLPPIEKCVPMDAGRVSHFDRVEALLDPSHMPFSGGERAMVQGYIRPIEGRRVDSAWLAMAADWFPPPAFIRLEPPTGGVSIDLTTHIHQPDLLLSDDDWLQARFEIRTSTNGLAVEYGLITTADGTPVAESMQTRLTAQD
jgi:acyl-CoA thioesterase